MRRHRFQLLGFAICFALVIATVARADAPTTRPIDRNTTEYTAAPVHAHFRVPKTWQRRQITGGSPDAIFVFDPAPSKTPKGITFIQIVEVYLSKPGDHQQTLEVIVNDTRKALSHEAPNIKFTKDQAITYVGQKAWTFQWTERTKITVTQQGGAPSADYVDIDRVETVWLQNDTICQIGLHADTRFIPSLMTKVEPVARSLTWDE